MRKFQKVTNLTKKCEVKAVIKNEVLKVTGNFRGPRQTARPSADQTGIFYKENAQKSMINSCTFCPRHSQIAEKFMSNFIRLTILLIFKFAVIMRKTANKILIISTILIACFRTHFRS